MADGVGAADRVRLAEQEVGQADLGVGVGASDLGERRPRSLPDLVRGPTEQAGDVLIALSALDQQLEQRALIPLQSHPRKPMQPGRVAAQPGARGSD